MKGENIATRLLVFGAGVVRLCRRLPDDASAKHIARQLGAGSKPSRDRIGNWRSGTEKENGPLRFFGSVLSVVGFDPIDLGVLFFVLGDPRGESGHRDLEPV